MITRQALVEAYAGGWRSFASVARDFGCSRQYIQQLTKRYNVPTFWKPGTPTVNAVMDGRACRWPPVDRAWREANGFCSNNQYGCYGLAVPGFRLCRRCQV